MDKAIQTRIRVPALTDAEVMDLMEKRTLLKQSDVDVVVTETEIGVRPDGTPLYILVRDCIPYEFCAAAYPVALRAADKPIVGGTRAIAAGAFMQPRIRLDGTVGKRFEVPALEHLKGAKNGIIGYYADRQPHGTPNCRLTSFAAEHLGEFKEMLPTIRRVAEVFHEYLPERYATQAAAARLIDSKFVIADSPFTTLTINRNWQTAPHTDQGDFKNGFGALSVLTAGEFTGGEFVFPKYRVAVRFRMQDVLLADVHEPHGNLPIVGTKGEYNRISLVFYLRENMLNVCPASSAVA